MQEIHMGSQLDRYPPGTKPVLLHPSIPHILGSHQEETRCSHHLAPRMQHLLPLPPAVGLTVPLTHHHRRRRGLLQAVVLHPMATLLLLGTNMPSRQHLHTNRQCRGITAIPAPVVPDLQRRSHHLALAQHIHTISIRQQQQRSRPTNTSTTRSTRNLQHSILHRRRSIRHQRLIMDLHHLVVPHRTRHIHRVPPSLIHALHTVVQLLRDLHRTRLTARRTNL
mmetsp:Transcript_6619/g.14418  ORF Transcript_6619/g.14418 Transcript_6619/m.14418 type:complete len:223 (+) Transcript_6619:690-1358(+)